MDAVEFLKTKRRMCSGGNCDKCSLRDGNNGTDYGCRAFCENYPEVAVAIVEKWSAEHPIKTRQSEFLKMFPNAKFDDNKTIDICPRRVDATIPERPRCYSLACHTCRKEYWLAEVE